MDHESLKQHAGNNIQILINNINQSGPKQGVIFHSISLRCIEGSNQVSLGLSSNPLVCSGEIDGPVSGKKCDQMLEYKGNIFFQK